MWPLVTAADAITLWPKHLQEQKVRSQIRKQSEEGGARLALVLSTLV